MMKMKALRLVAGLTQDDVSKAIGVARPTVFLWESGAALPRRSNLEKLAALYGCKISELLEDDAEVK
jgi:transcriptional regulator with XRE-family HTH domain